MWLKEQKLNDIKKILKHQKMKKKIMNLTLVEKTHFTSLLEDILHQFHNRC